MAQKLLEEKKYYEKLVSPVNPEMTVCVILNSTNNLSNLHFSLFYS